MRREDCLRYLSKGRLKGASLLPFSSYDVKYIALTPSSLRDILKLCLDRFGDSRERKDRKCTLFTLSRNAVRVLLMFYYTPLSGFSGTYLFEDNLRIGGSISSAPFQSSPPAYSIKTSAKKRHCQIPKIMRSADAAFNIFQEVNYST